MHVVVYVDDDVDDVLDIPHHEDVYNDHYYDDDDADGETNAWHDQSNFRDSS